MVPAALSVPARRFGRTPSRVGDLAHAGVCRKDQLFVDRLTFPAVEVVGVFPSVPTSWSQGVLYLDTGYGNIPALRVPEVDYTNVARIPLYGELALVGGFTHRRKTSE
jgi:hypothetical protein